MTSSSLVVVVLCLFFVLVCLFVCLNTGTLKIPFPQPVTVTSDKNSRVCIPLVRNLSLAGSFILGSPRAIV